MLNKMKFVSLAVLLASLVVIVYSDCCCNQASKHNWKQCAWKNINSGANNAVIRGCPFYKQRADSHLRVVWSGNMRQHLAGKCSRWYITFNGKECNSPLPIDGVVYQSVTNNILRAGGIEGYCGNIPAGSVNVELRVELCQSHNTGSPYTGWPSYSRLIIEEVDYRHVSTYTGKISF